MRRYQTLKFTHFEGLDNLWKILFLLVSLSALEGKVPDSGVTLACEDDQRQGKKCNIRSLKPKERAKWHNNFQEIGPLLFNVLPISIRNMKWCSIDEFKEKLDSFLTLVPDKPKVGGMMPLNSEQSNSLLYQTKRMRGVWKDDI